MRMPVLGLIPYSEPPTLGTVLEIERMRLRLRAVEAQLEARDSAPPSPPARVLARRFLAVMSGVTTVALVVIAGSLVWSQTHPVPPSQPTIVMQAPPPAAQVSAQAPAFRSPGLLLPPMRPGPRG
jgi:hypothetical protein